MGSDSDAPVMQAAVDVLRDAADPVRDDRRLGAPIAGARHAPRARGARAGASRSSSSAPAPRRTWPASSPRTRSLPVIGVPIDSSALKGLDALLSTVQMPPGVPVATVSIGKPGATNAGVLAAQILAVGDPAVAARARGLQEEARGEGRAGGGEAAQRGADAMRYSIVTFGCRVNQADSLRLEEDLRARGAAETRRPPKPISSSSTPAR